MDDKAGSVGPSAPGSRESLDRDISELIRNSLGGEPANDHSVAPVILPEKGDLAVRLVTQHSLDRLRDAESDQRLFDSTFWCLVGGVLGFFTNVVTGGQAISSEGYIFLGGLVVGTLFLVMLRVRVGRRVRTARNRIDRNS